MSDKLSQNESVLGGLAGSTRPIDIQARKQPLSKTLYRDRYLYLFLVPVLAFYLVFRYLPLGGLIIAFKDYRLNLGILGSPWAGFKYFERLFASRDFYRVVRNTLFLNVYGLVAGFPVPILLAVLLNEVRSTPFKKGVQTMLYLPHFISWVILGGIIINILSPGSGFVNTVLDALFGVRIFFLGQTEWWPTVYVLSGIWRSAGWGTIIYLAAISGIDPQLFEAAIIDGANKLRQIWHITIPGIAPTIVILLILRMGQMLNIGFEQVFMLQNLAVREVADVISTYVYRVGIEGFQYSFTTALGVFQSAIGFILILTANWISNRITGTGIW